jgi:hypothetical protein
VKVETPGKNFQHIKGDGFVQWSAPNRTVIRSKRDEEPRRGIYLKGACDLPALLFIGDLLQGQVKGTVGVMHAGGGIANARADILLQTLDGIPAEHTREVVERLRLIESYFRPVLFEPSFTMKKYRGGTEFPKTVVVLSLVPNILRTIYRHREHGFLVDPGGMWLNRVDEAVGDKVNLKWVRERFTSVGRLSVDEFALLFTRLVGELRQRTGAHLLVTNALTVEPGERTHSYQLRKEPESLRRREFSIRLAELSRDLGFHVIDVDRVLKLHGIDRQLDFAHFPLELGPPIAEEAVRVLRDLEVV